MASKAKIDGFPQNYLYPATAYSEVLDWLAQFCGYTGNYWSTDWQIAAKRELLLRSYDFVWVSKGTRQLLEWLFALFQLQGRVYLLGEFLAGRDRVPAPVGGDPFVYFVLTPIAYLRTSREWALLERLNRLYGPVYAESRVCYEYFYAAFSVAGDPVFTASTAEFGLLLTESGFGLLTESGDRLNLDYTANNILTESGDLLLTEAGDLLQYHAPTYLLGDVGWLATEAGDRLELEAGRAESTGLFILKTEDGGELALETGENYFQIEPPPTGLLMQEDGYLIRLETGGYLRF